ncbi:MAG: hypothetical protein HRU03_01190 [Nanoarchaeales archaeon]|nr:hypothetical protein [Nanoarchaeales archaeon]
MLKNKLRNFTLIGLVLFLSGCSRSGTNPVQRAFESFGTTLTTLIHNPNVLFGMMFVAMLIGSFAMFKGLLRFAFSKNFSDSTFGPKEINVLALMLSIIGTIGIFYIFRAEKSQFISLFGGMVGLLFVLFLCVLIMRYFLSIAKSFENSDGALGKGAGWIAVTTIGVIISLFFLVGYAGKVLMSIGCVISDGSKDLSCSVLGNYNIFVLIYNHGSSILTWAIFIAIVFGIIYLNKKNSDASSSSSSSSKSDEKSGDSGILGSVFGGGSSKSLSKEVEVNVKDMQGNLKTVANGLKVIKKSINKQHDILNKISNQLRGSGNL